MAWPELIVFVRHAESEGNIRSSDQRAEFDVSSHLYDLTPRGIKQAELTGKYLRDTYGEFDVYYQSYYARTKQTLETMYPEAKIFEESRLAEGQRGIWHTMTQSQIENRFPEEVLRKQRESLYHYRPLGGENWPDIELRVHSFLGTLERDHGGKKVLCAVHGHWLVLLQKVIHHLSIEEAISRYTGNGTGIVHKNASVTIYKEGLVDGISSLILQDENIVPWKGDPEADTQGESFLA